MPESADQAPPLPVVSGRQLTHAAPDPAPAGMAAADPTTGLAAASPADSAPADSAPVSPVPAGAPVGRTASEPPAAATIPLNAVTARPAPATAFPTTASPAGHPLARPQPPPHRGPPPRPGSGPHPPVTEPGLHGLLGEGHPRRRWQRVTRPAGTPLAGLSNDPRLPGWIRRALVSAAAGLILGVWIDWRLGLAAAAVAALADTVYSIRTRAVIPASARMTSAQRRTRRRLARLAPSGYLALHTRAVPGTGAVIDHLIVGPAGVYAIGSLRWDRRLPVRATQGRLFHGPFDETGRLEQVRQSAAQAAALIGGVLGQRVTVHAALVIHGPTVPWIVARIGGVDVFRGRRLRRYLRRQASINRARRLGDRQIELVAAIAAQVLPPAR